MKTACIFSKCQIWFIQCKNGEQNKAQCDRVNNITFITITCWCDAISVLCFFFYFYIFFVFFCSFEFLSPLPSCIIFRFGLILTRFFLVIRYFNIFVFFYFYCYYPHLRKTFCFSISRQQFRNIMRKRSL